ncbi:uncharacterized protein DS421_3g69760 [Arachis hypogaea]|nr:uncharacterized protein DS421_3g69760 [Arachis hypogaea]
MGNTVQSVQVLFVCHDIQLELPRLLDLNPQFLTVTLNLSLSHSLGPQRSTQRTELKSSAFSFSSLQRSAFSFVPKPSSTHFRVPSSPLTLAESQSLSHRRFSVLVASWVLATTGLGPGLLGLVLSLLVSLSRTLGLLIYLHHCDTAAPRLLCPGPRLF